jgi:hypothetical protein
MRESSKSKRLLGKDDPDIIPRQNQIPIVYPNYPAPNNFQNASGIIKSQMIMTVDGALIVYYATNLMLLGKYEDALKLIENFGVKLESDIICQANLKKL